LSSSSLLLLLLLMLLPMLALFPLLPRGMGRRGRRRIPSMRLACGRLASPAPPLALYARELRVQRGPLIEGSVWALSALVAPFVRPRASSSSSAAAAAPPPPPAIPALPALPLQPRHLLVKEAPVVAAHGAPRALRLNTRMNPQAVQQAGAEHTRKSTRRSHVNSI